MTCVSARLSLFEIRVWLGVDRALLLDHRVEAIFFSSLRNSGDALAQNRFREIAKTRAASGPHASARRAGPDPGGTSAEKPSTPPREQRQL